MTYTTGDAWERRAGYGATARTPAPTDDSEQLKQAHLDRLRSPAAPIHPVPSIHSATPTQLYPQGVSEITKRRYEISALMDDGEIQTHDYLATKDFFLEDICANFARGTLIATPTGQTPIEDLAPGDMIKTRDNGAMPLRWIASCQFGGPDTASDLTGFPIRIKADALGDLRPVQDLMVSPRFRVLTNHPGCAALFGSSEALAPAIAMMDEDTILQMHPPQDIQFYNLMLDSHQIIQTNGLDTESYHPGEYGVSAMSLEMRHHLRNLVPHLDGDFTRFGRTARPVLKGFEAQVLRVG